MHHQLNYPQVICLPELLHSVVGQIYYVSRFPYDGCAITINAATLPRSAITDLIVATLPLKYTQSYSMVYALSRLNNGIVCRSTVVYPLHATCGLLAGSKVDASDDWWLRHHPHVLALPFNKGVKRAEKANTIHLFVGGEIFKGGEREQWDSLFEEIPLPSSQHPGACGPRKTVRQRGVFERRIFPITQTTRIA